MSRRKDPSRTGQADKTIRSIPLNFLLGCSDSALANFELARLGSAADLRGELHAVLDKLIDEMAQAALTAWFRTIDRATLKQVLESPDDPIARAKEQIRIARTGDKELTVGESASNCGNVRSVLLIKVR